MKRRGRDDIPAGSAKESWLWPREARHDCSSAPKDTPAVSVANDIRRLRTFDVAQAFHDPAVFHPHEVNAAHGILRAVTPPVTPANDRAVLSHEDLFEVEVGVRRGCDRLPQRHTRCAPHMA